MVMILKAAPKFYRSDLNHCPRAEEAAESMEDPNGRWFAFAVTGESYIIMERKSIPQHLQQLENLEMCVSLQSMLTDRRTWRTLARSLGWATCQSVTLFSPLLLIFQFG